MSQRKDYLFKIHTPYGDTYFVNDKGEITTKEYPYSGSWKIQGIESVKSNDFIPFNKMTKENINSLVMTYKNGNPKFTVRDLDHGTTRVWGNTKVHGIKFISFNSNLKLV